MKAEEGETRKPDQALGLAFHRVAALVHVVASRADGQERYQGLGLELPLPAAGLEYLRNLLQRRPRMVAGRDRQPHPPVGLLHQSQIQFFHQQVALARIVDLHLGLFGPSLLVVVGIQLGPGDVELAADQGLAESVFDVEYHVDFALVFQDHRGVVPAHFQGVHPGLVRGEDRDHLDQVDIGQGALALDLQGQGSLLDIVADQLDATGSVSQGPGSKDQLQGGGLSGFQREGGGFHRRFGGFGVRFHAQVGIAGVGGHQGSRFAFSQDDVVEVERTGWVQFEVCGHPGAVEQDLAGLERLVPVALQLQDAGDDAARRRGKGDADRQRVEPVGRENELGRRADLGVDREALGIARADVGDGEIRVADVEQFYLLVAGFAHDDPVEVHGGGTQREVLADAVQADLAVAGLGLHQERGPALTGLSGVEFQRYFLVLARLQEDRGGFDFDFPHDLGLDVQMHGVGRAAAVPQQQVIPLVFADGDRAEVDDVRIENLDDRRADPGDPQQRNFHAGGLGVVGAQIDFAAGPSLVPGAENDADLLALARQDRHCGRRIPRARKSAARGLHAVDEQIGLPLVEDGEIPRAALADFEVIEVQPDFRQGGKRRPGSQGLTFQVQFQALGVQIGSVDDQPVLVGSALGGLEDYRDGPFLARGQFKRTGGGELEGGSRHGQEEAVDDQRDAAGIGEGEGAMGFLPHLERAQVQSLGRIRGDVETGADHPRAQGDREGLGLEEGLDLQGQLALVFAGRRGPELYVDGFFGMACQAEGLGRGGEVFPLHPHQHLQIVRSGILEENLTGSAPPQLDRPQVQRLGPDLERLGSGRCTREKPEEEQNESGEPTDESSHK